MEKYLETLFREGFDDETDKPIKSIKSINPSEPIIQNSSSKTHHQTIDFTHEVWLIC